MPVSSSDILGLAKNLTNGSTECEWRTSVSRSYYAALHVALMVADDPAVSRHLQDRATLQGVGFSTALVKAFTWAGAPSAVKSAGYVLDQLRKQRVAADYIVDTSFQKTQAEAAAKLAEKVIDKLTALRTLP